MNSLKRFFQSIAGRAVALALLISAPIANSAAETGQTFASPEAAVSALVAAATAQDTNALRVIFGPAAADLQNPDRVQATNDLNEFVSAFNQTNRLVRESDAKCVLEVGNNFWPFPVPLVKQDGQWFFDTAAGKDELLNRRIGRNELLTLQSVRAYVEAQREYATKDRDGDEVLGSRRSSSAPPARKTDFTGRRSWTAKSVRSARSSPRRRPRVTGKARGAGRRPGAVPRLFLQDSHPPGQACARRQIRLHHQRKHDRRLRAGGLACRLWRNRHHDVHREPARPGLSKGPGTARQPGRRRA